jgi:Cysteine rich repeat
MACRGDASKFCAEHVGKPPQMNACLRENKAKLSDGCRKVVESHGG